MKLKTIIAGLVLFPVLASAEMSSMGEAEKAIFSSVPDRQTFYAGCAMWPGYIPRPKLESCGLEGVFDGRKNKVDSGRIAVDHVVSMNRLLFKDNLPRDCFKKVNGKPNEEKIAFCAKEDFEFKKAYLDLVNLYPVVKILKKDRRGKKIGAVEEETQSYGTSNVFNGKKYFQIRPDMVGDYARIAFYMHYAYGVNYDKEEIKIFKSWAEMDPVSSEEIARNKSILKIQGWANPYVIGAD